MLVNSFIKSDYEDSEIEGMGPFRGCPSHCLVSIHSVSQFSSVMSLSSNTGTDDDREIEVRTSVIFFAPRFYSRLPVRFSKHRHCQSAPSHPEGDPSVEDVSLLMTCKDWRDARG